MTEPVRPRLSRRLFCTGATIVALGAEARAQTPAPPPAPQPTPLQERPAPPAPFRFADVQDIARQRAAAPYAPPPTPLQPPLGYDDYRDIRFRSDQAFFGGVGSKFRLELFPTGAVGATPVAVNLVSGGVAERIVFSPDLFDFGPLVDDTKRASVDGFAGLRLRYPLNDPAKFDEAAAFLRATYFRFVGRGQVYGQSARGLAIGAGDPTQPEEFPAFREFWAFAPAPNDESIEICALLDSPSLTGAYRMIVNPGRDTAIAVEARLFARVAVDRLGFAPLSSMYLTGESGPRIVDDFRMEVHDADGLEILSRTQRWTWRPLRNPAAAARSVFADPPAGFGLIQRQRDRSAYQDLEAEYDLRPSVWIEPTSGFDDGRIELVELPESVETGDNIVAQWRPNAGLAAHQDVSFAYRMTTRDPAQDDAAIARAVHTLIARPGANMAGAPPGARRFFIDFAGDALTPFLAHPGDLQLVAAVPGGKAEALIEAHIDAPKLRVTLDATPPTGSGGVATLQLAWMGRPVSETWSFPLD